MSIFQMRHTNYFCLHIFSQWKQSLCNGRNGTIWVFWGRCQTQRMVLMTSSVIALPLLLTPALKNNIWQACHHQTVAVQRLGLSFAQTTHPKKKQQPIFLSWKGEVEISPDCFEYLYYAPITEERMQCLVDFHCWLVQQHGIGPATDK